MLPTYLWNLIVDFLLLFMWSHNWRMLFVSLQSFFPEKLISDLKYEDIRHESVKNSHLHFSFCVHTWCTTLILWTTLRTHGTYCSPNRSTSHAMNECSISLTLSGFKQWVIERSDYGVDCTRTLRYGSYGKILHESVSLATTLKLGFVISENFLELF